MKVGSEGDAARPVSHGGMFRERVSFGDESRKRGRRGAPDGLFKDMRLYI